MKITSKVLAFLALTVSLATMLTAAEPKLLRFGVSPGPYGDLIIKGIKPSLEKKGYKVELVTFQDWVQPNLALNNGETEANLFQHGLYLAKFSKDHDLQLSPVVLIPTAGLGIYSEKIKSLDQLKEGDEVTLPLDPTNLARALRFLQKAGLVKLKPEIDATKVTDRDIAENPHGLKFVPTEAAQIPRTLGSATLAVASGNYAIAAGLKLSDALVLEKLDDTIKITLAVRTADLDKQWVKDIKEAIESESFRDVVENPANIFSSFQKPDWYVAKWSKPASK
jgi:D-methionine transport system substrate-binding protein